MVEVVVFARCSARLCEEAPHWQVMTRGEAEMVEAGGCAGEMGTLEAWDGRDAWAADQKSGNSCPLFNTKLFTSYEPSL